MRGRPNFLYAIQMANQGPIKIGITTDIIPRLSDLQVGQPEKLVVRAVVRAPASAERVVHQALVAHALSGEWFAPHDDVIRMIESFGEMFWKIEYAESAAPDGAHQATSGNSRRRAAGQIIEECRNESIEAFHRYLASPENEQVRTEIVLGYHNLLDAVNKGFLAGAIER
jgi:hypothetical protein